MKAILNLVVSATLILTAHSQTCDMQFLGTCLRSAVTEWPKYNDVITQSAQSQLPNVTSEELSTLCNVTTNLGECLGNSLADCSRNQTLPVELILSSIAFVCNTEDEFFENNMCLSDPSFINETTSCMNIGEFSIYETLQNSEQTSEICSLLDGSVTCVTDITNAYCGQRSSDYMTAYIMTLTGPVQDLLGCHAQQTLTDTSDKTEATTSEQPHVTSDTVSATSLSTMSPPEVATSPSNITPEPQDVSPQNSTPEPSLPETEPITSPRDDTVTAVTEQTTSDESTTANQVSIDETTQNTGIPTMSTTFESSAESTTTSIDIGLTTSNNEETITTDTFESANSTMTTTTNTTFESSTTSTMKPATTTTMEPTTTTAMDPTTTTTMEPTTPKITEKLTTTTMEPTTTTTMEPTTTTSTMKPTTTTTMEPTTPKITEESTTTTMEPTTTTTMEPTTTMTMKPTTTTTLEPTTTTTMEPTTSTTMEPSTTITPMEPTTTTTMEPTTTTTPMEPTTTTSTMKPTTTTTMEPTTTTSTMKPTTTTTMEPTTTTTMEPTTTTTMEPTTSTTMKPSTTTTTMEPTTTSTMEPTTTSTNEPMTSTTMEPTTTKTMEPTTSTMEPITTTMAIPPPSLPFESITFGEDMDSETSCDNTVIAQCIVNSIGASPYYTQMLEATTTGVFPQLSANELEELCMSVGALDTCLEEESKGCTGAHLLQYTSLRHTFNYICGAGKQAFSQTAKCFAEPDIVLDTQSCLLEPSQEIGALVSMVASSPDLFMESQRLCSLLETTKHCFVNAANNHCSRDQALSVLSYISNVIEPTRNFFFCPLQEITLPTDQDIAIEMTTESASTSSAEATTTDKMIPDEATTVQQAAAEQTTIPEEATTTGLTSDQSTTTEQTTEVVTTDEQTTTTTPVSAGEDTTTMNPIVTSETTTVDIPMDEPKLCFNCRYHGQFEFKKEEMSEKVDQYCIANGIRGFCPIDTCRCDDSDSEVLVPECEVRGLLRNVPGYKEWCERMCNQGHCKIDPCDCHMVPSHISDNQLA